MAMPKIACNAELAPKIVLLLLLVTLVVCGALTLVSFSVCAYYHTCQSLHLHANMTDAMKKAICTWHLSPRRTLQLCASHTMH